MKTIEVDKYVYAELLRRQRPDEDSFDRVILEAIAEDERRAEKRHLLRRALRR